MNDSTRSREVLARPVENISADTAGRLKGWYILIRKMFPGPGAGIVVTLDQGQIGQIFISENLTQDAKPALATAVAAAAKADAPISEDGVLALPLRRGGEIYAALALQLDLKDGQQRSALRLLTWGERWQRLLLSAGSPQATPDTVEPASADTPSPALLELVLATEPLQAALMALADELAAQLNCDRVAIGLKNGSGFKLEALSHGVQFDARSSLASAIADAMAAAEDEPAYWPSDDSDSRLLDILEGEDRDRAICVIPLGAEAAAVCERPLDQPFQASDIAGLMDSAPLLGAVLALKRGQDANVHRRAMAATGGLVKRLFGPGHVLAKGIAAGIAVVLLLLTLVPGTFRVHADATIEGRVQRAVVAPFDGFIAEANKRAGDTVEAGEVIAQLEDRELLLEMRKSASEEEKLDKEYRRALAAEDRSEARIVQARLAQVQAQTRLLREKLDRVQLSAPVAGIVISGDLSRSLGAPVERGDVLFEVAPLDEYRLILYVDESSVSHVAEGQSGTLTLTALPGNTYSFTVEQVSPVFTEREGRVSYRTEGRIDGEVPVLRPGMEGVGKIDIERRSYGYIFFHRLLEWLQLKLWLWLP